MAKKRTGIPSLFRKTNGVWAAKIKGKQILFGADEEVARQRLLDELPFILAGRKPPRTDGTPALDELANVFADRCRKRVSSGELAERSLVDYTATI